MKCRKLGQERFRLRQVELELRWQLKQQDAEFFAQIGHLPGECLERFAAFGQFPLMTDLLRNLDRKAEIPRHLVAPPRPGLLKVGPMERAVDLDHREPLGITRQRRPLGRKSIGDVARLSSTRQFRP